jgi:hypothetical protein
LTAQLVEQTLCSTGRKRERGKRVRRWRDGIVQFSAAFTQPLFDTSLEPYCRGAGRSQLRDDAFPIRDEDDFAPRYGAQLLAQPRLQFADAHGAHDDSVVSCDCIANQRWGSSVHVHHALRIAEPHDLGM